MKGGEKYKFRSSHAHEKCRAGRYRGDLPDWWRAFLLAWLVMFFALGIGADKALGLGASQDPTYGTPPRFVADANIAFANSFKLKFDYEHSFENAATQYDFISIAAHEIDHALGFSSHIDVGDTRSCALDSSGKTSLHER